MEFSIQYVGSFNRWSLSGYDSTFFNRLSVELIYRNPTERYLRMAIVYDKMSIDFDVTNDLHDLQQIKKEQKVLLSVDASGNFKLSLPNSKQISLGKPSLSKAPVWRSPLFEGDLEVAYKGWLTRFGFNH